MNQQPRFTVFAAALLLLATAFAGQATNVSPANKHIVYTGRVNFSTPQSPIMVYPGTTIDGVFTGSSIKMQAKAGSGYFEVKIDGQKPKKVNFTAKDSVLSLAENLTGDSHRVQVMLVYEGYNARPEFRGFILDRGAKMLPVRMSDRRIEFIGNSITCGYGIEAANEKIHYQDSTENHYFTYAAIAARSLNARSMVVARSGIGAYRNCCKHSAKGDKGNDMPHWYDYTLLYDSTQVWNHRAYSPQVICVNLGTNDLSTDPYDVSLYKESYKAFMRHLRALHPKAHIVMLAGCMLSGKRMDDQHTALDAICQEMKAEGDSRVYRFNFTTQDGTLGYGADYHPSLGQHARMAAELIPFLKEITGW